MNKFFLLLLILILSIKGFAQNNNPVKHPDRCSTETPPNDWDVIFNQMVELTKQNKSDERTKSTTYLIPVIFHVLYDSQAIGTFPNKHHCIAARFRRRNFDVLSFFRYIFHKFTSCS